MTTERTYPNTFIRDLAAHMARKTAQKPEVEEIPATMPICRLTAPQRLAMCAYHGTVVRIDDSGIIDLVVEMPSGSTRVIACDSTGTLRLDDQVIVTVKQIGQQVTIKILGRADDSAERNRTCH